MLKKNHIKAKDGKYYLPGVRPISWSLRNKYSRELFDEASLSIKLLEKIPWIKMLSVTGAVASNNASKDDDIDIFIVTQKGRVWITRLFVFIILKIIGKYAQGKDNQKKLCCNLFVDESKIMWSEKKQNFYIAYEIMSMHPLINRDDAYFKFLKKNEWLFAHFKNFKVEFPTSFKDSPKGNSFLNRLEDLARELQLWYMRKKKTSEVTTKSFIHFNKHDHTNDILSEYSENIANL